MSTTASVTAYPTFADQIPGAEFESGPYEIRFARDSDDLDRILELRFEVFNLELGEGLESSFETRRDADAFDPGCHHLMVVDRRSQVLAGTYRMQTGDMAKAHVGYYSATEFDFSAMPEEILANAIEIGRACVAESHRNTHTLFSLWRGLALYVAHNRTRYLFGCSSLTSQDPAEGHQLWRQLEGDGHVHPELHLKPLAEYACPPEKWAGDEQVSLPPLFRIYLRYGAKVCGGPAIDRHFRTIDYLMLFDVEAMDERSYKMFFQ